MKRRLFLTAAAAAAIGYAAYRIWPDEGLRNPCAEAILPEGLARHDLLRAVWQDIDASQVWDCHVHLTGPGDGGGGLWINPAMYSLRHPIQFLQRIFYENASCVRQVGRYDEDFISRLLALHDGFMPGTRLMLLGFDHFYDERGKRHEDKTAFHTPNAAVQALANRFPTRFEWIASIHPYRADALEALAGAISGGARAVKWLPSAMGIDPAAARCDRFYDSLARHRLPLLVHAGEEAAVSGAEAREWNNPLKLRRALDRGVRVIVAHCASLGSGVDFDRGPNGPHVENFALFARLMDEPRYEGLLYGEISAMTQRNRMGTALRTVLTRSEWHPRLINGSDYPLPGVMPLFSLKRFVAEGYVPAAEAEILSRLRRHNALLFDFALKRRLRMNGSAFAPIVFHSARLWRSAKINS